MDDSASNDGWSQVVSRGPAARTLKPEPGVGQKSSFTVLGSRLKEEKIRKEQMRKKMEAEVVDDWEDEIRKEEQGATFANSNSMGAPVEASESA